MDFTTFSGRINFFNLHFTSPVCHMPNNLILTVRIHNLKINIISQVFREHRLVKS